MFGMMKWTVQKWYQIPFSKISMQIVLCIFRVDTGFLSPMNDCLLDLLQIVLREEVYIGYLLTKHMFL